MSTTNALPRSPELMSRSDSALLIVDVQEKLIPLISGKARLLWNLRRLLDGAATLGVPAAGTEQYPRGLGATVPDLAARLPGPLPSKLTFSCSSCGDIFHAWRALGRFKLLVTGIEAHVCVQQTVFDLLTAGFRVYVPVDAVGSRFPLDRDIALRRMEASGVTLTTTEAALFEWCEVAGTPEFKQISALIREQPPAESEEMKS